MSELRYCTICGSDDRGPHSSACNQPGQEWLTEEQLSERRKRFHGGSRFVRCNLSPEELDAMFAEQRRRSEAARAALRHKGRLLWEEEGLGL